jgi:hypothetical protein
VRERKDTKREGREMKKQRKEKGRNSRKDSEVLRIKQIVI